MHFLKFILRLSNEAFYEWSHDRAARLGAAGSLVVVMIWIAYPAQIVFSGAKFSLVHASAIGKPILPASYAMRVRLSPVDIQPLDENDDGNA